MTSIASGLNTAIPKDWDKIWFLSNCGGKENMCFVDGCKNRPKKKKSGRGERRGRISNFLLASNFRKHWKSLKMEGQVEPWPPFHHFLLPLSAQTLFSPSALLTISSMLPSLSLPLPFYPNTCGGPSAALQQAVGFRFCKHSAAHSDSLKKSWLW